MFKTNKHSDSNSGQKARTQTKDYVRTTDQQKLQLVDLVINEKYSMKLASEIIGVKLSTVKYIVKAYKTDKQFFLAKLRPKNINLQKEHKIQLGQQQVQPKQGANQKNQSAEESAPNSGSTPKTNLGIAQSKPQYFLNNQELFQNYFQVLSQWNHFFSLNNN